jgi:hypothetical protein
MTGAATPKPSSEAERTKLIAEYTDAKRSEIERHSVEQRAASEKKRRRKMVVLFSLLGLTLYLAVQPPAFLLPAPVTLPTPAERAASIRFAMYVQAQQVEHFRATQGRLPATLNEVGNPVPGVEYRVLDNNTYQLASTADTALRLTSTDSLRQFLGSSLQLLGAPQ